MFTENSSAKTKMPLGQVLNGTTYETRPTWQFAVDED
jgi:hypothetical protein